MKLPPEPFSKNGGFFRQSCPRRTLLRQRPHLPHSTRGNQALPEYLAFREIATCKRWHSRGAAFDHPPILHGQIVNREIIVRQDQSVRKSVRIGRSDLNAEKRNQMLIKANTTVPVPHVRNYYRTADFEHLVMDKMPGTTLEMAWPMLSAQEREFVADQVVTFIHQFSKLQSSEIQAALLQRRPLRTGLRTATDFCRERVRDYSWNKRIAAFVDDRSAAVGDQPNVFTHGDLDWGNIMVAEGRVCGMLDLESSGFFPPYWEWVTVKRLSQGHPDGSWFCLLEQRLRNVGCPEWDRMWEVEQIIMALNRHSQWALTPEARQANRMRGWHELAEILGEDQGDPPLVAYSTAAEHPWWLESVRRSDGRGEEQGEQKNGRPGAANEEVDLHLES